MGEYAKQIVAQAEKAMNEGKISSHDLYIIMKQATETEKKMLQGSVGYSDANKSFGKPFNIKRNF